MITQAVRGAQDSVRNLARAILGTPPQQVPFQKITVSVRPDEAVRLGSVLAGNRRKLYVYMREGFLYVGVHGKRECGGLYFYNLLF
jgi:hypothetical protein